MAHQAGLYPKVGLIACLILMALPLSLAMAAEVVTVVRDGRAMLSIVPGSLQEPVQQFQNDIERISAARLQTAGARPGANGVYIGLVDDFPWLKIDGDEELGPEGFVIRSEDGNLYLLAEQPLGLTHAVVTFARLLGHRQFFPGSVWEVVPTHRTIQGAWNQRQLPHYSSTRSMWYGFSAEPQVLADLDQWNVRNRMGGPEPVNIRHTWYGLDPAADFQRNPEWFALVERDGQMVRVANKPCYTHPAVIQQMIDDSLAQARAGAASISLSPADGLNFCECDRCQAVFAGGEPFRAHGTMFATRPDGVMVNIVSETLFTAVNRVAEAVAAEFPRVIIGCYAYSAYSHPTSFELHPNVYIQTTTHFRRTPLSLQEQLTQWGQRARQVGIREYWAVYQWDYDNPDPGKMRPDQLRDDLRFFHANNVVAMNTEASANWGARGLGYYVAAQLLWDLDADVPGLVREFYEQSFGPAAAAMERYHARWYGPSAVVGLDPRSQAIAAASGLADEAGDQDELTGTRPVYGTTDLAGTRRTLAAAFADLDEAASLTRDHREHRARVDHMRLYACYLHLRLKVWEAAAGGDSQAIVAAVRDETLFGGRLTYTSMVHARPLIGRGFHRRFSAHMEQLALIPEAQEEGKGWRVVGQPPSSDELEHMWAVAKVDLAR